MNYDLLNRYLTRCKEIAEEQGVPASVKQVFDFILKGPADSFLAAHAELTKAESSWRKENVEAAGALERMDPIYRTARSVLAANIPTAMLPDTLKAARTDTDMVLAVEQLLHMAEAQSAEPWAKTVLDGEFGKLAPGVIKEVNEAITASKELGAARDVRAKAYGLAYEKYLAFKRVVRDAYGSNSKQYQRIHVRTRETDPTPVTPPVTPT